MREPPPQGSLTTTVIAGPVGPLRLYWADGVLCGLYFDGHRPAPPARLAAAVPVRAADVAGDPVVVQLGEYFDGSRRRFDLARLGVGTPFQQEVWAALVEVPYGRTVTYGALAALLGRPTAVRAVAAANARNPLSIVVPCHRVVGAGGSLTGYAGGVQRKRWLLDHEAAVTGR